jgi:large subunit ribosomal protein L21
MYAIVETGGKQYRVKTGDTIAVERLSGQPGEVLELGRVLLVAGKVRYRRKTGHRQALTRVRITDILLDGASAASARAEVATREPEPEVVAEPVVVEDVAAPEVESTTPEIESAPEVESTPTADTPETPEETEVEA